MHQIFLLSISLFLWHGPSFSALAENNSPSESKALAGQQGIGLMQAVQVTLFKQPAVLIQQQEVANSEGTLQREAGIFDPAFESSVDYKKEKLPFADWERVLYGIGGITDTTTESSVSLKKKTRYGISFGPSVKISRDQATKQDPDGNRIPISPNLALVYFTVDVPLLKGWGKQATDADEMAAREQLEASQLDLEQTISDSVLDTTETYWAYLEALKQLQVLREMEKDAKRTLKHTKLLVQGHAQPASDLETLEGNLAQKTSQRVAGEQKLFEARQDLGLAMGLAFGAIDNLPLPADPFPDSEKEKTPPINVNPDVLFQEALQRRADFRALKKREKAARILLTAADKNVLPQLDFNAGVGYAGQQEGREVYDYLQSLEKNMTGVNYSAGLKLTYPFGNNEAEGQVIQRRSSLNKAIIQTRDIERKINSGILVAVQALWRILKELRETRSSIAHFTTAVKNEQMKFGMGMASVLDVINMQDRLLSVRLDEVSQMSKFADAVVQLSYQSGTLVAADGEGYKIEMKSLTDPWSAKWAGQ